MGRDDKLNTKKDLNREEKMKALDAALTQIEKA